MFWLRSAVQLLFVVIIVMCIVGFAVMKNSIRTLDGAIQDISSAAELRNGMTGVRKAGLYLFNVQQGFLPASQEDAERRNLYYQARNLTKYNEELYLHMADMTPELQALYTAPNILVESIIDGVVKTESLNLWQAMNSFISHAFLLHETPLAEMSETHPNYFVRVNGVIICL